eukprot:sb/3470359/
MMYKLSLKDKALSEDAKIGDFETFCDGSVLYFKDLGTQIGWSTVFLAEYIGPIFTYLIFYLARGPIYGATQPTTQIQKTFTLYILTFQPDSINANSPPLPQFGELGNLSCHIAFKNMRPPGTKTRVIPMPNSNPFTLLFNLVSCPNYTYEVISWIGFAIFTCVFYAALFAVVGGGQMLQWALGKHKNYKKEFEKYPKGRKAMIPFIM